MAASKPRYLLVWQDNLLAGQTQLDVDYLGTGMTITPFARPQTGRMGRFGRTLLYGLRLLFRRYDHVILPAVVFDWNSDPSRLRWLIRKAIVFTVSIRLGGPRCLLSWLLPPRDRICVLDRKDATEVYKEYARAVDAGLYLKTNLPVAAQQESSQEPFVLGFLPFWVMAGHYPAPSQPKDVDLFYSASDYSEARRLASAELKLLEQEGFRIVAAAERLSAAEYVSLLQRSHLTLSPEGHGYHCFRHYEAMLSGSVPVVNRPVIPTVTDLADGQTCLLYDAQRPGDLARVVRTALQDRSRLQTWGAKLRQFALANHSLEGVGRFVIEAIAGAQPEPRMMPR